ncbi:efflux RND transporter periplasmic adaptor subunit [Fulvimarina sp. 2208YS6-2-32]|uniref:Efflux RND transporter periplasmic adaptor subunit n=1 Tax=Fulvimarina uroteuthidis TaxID=3098149 RepID=A0ABU5I607_9HYPH|nr:efflux RND transporter periplasmic adaptor subunit [Fulvimarina sp. 2208YS6-2-32]MDY8110343.1 efflux RND transporter periplasmic adaptor subunit [Fulvimarina sp. 2208YS6-2-32]
MSFPVPGSAQEGGSATGTQAEAGSQPTTIDLPIVGTVELPGWLSFLGSSSSDQSTSAQGSGEGGEAGSQPPPAVVVTAAGLRSVGDEFEFIGTIEAIETVTLQSRVNGFIEQVFFQGGDTVAIGDVLFKIEDDQYQASLDAANARLAGAEAQLAEAERSLSRAQELIDSGTIPAAELDTQRATFESARATRLQAQAAVRQAELNLDYTSITAPIDGVISEPLITKGNFVSAASGTLANIVQLDPIWGTFPIGEDRLSTLRRVGASADNASQSAENYRLSLKLSGDEAFRPDGSFAFVGNTVDPSTGTIEVRVRFPNPEGRLLPNENVTLVAAEKDPPRFPVVSLSAIQLNREGKSVFVLNEDNDTVRRQPVETGKEMRGSVAITSGVAAGDLVVVQGIQNLSDGAKVTPTYADGGSGAVSATSGEGAASEAAGTGDSADAGGEAGQ